MPRDWRFAHWKSWRPHKTSRLTATATTTASYDYQPIDAAKLGIRVLEVLAGQRSDPLRCNVKHMSLAEAHPDFEAISYCWQTLPGEATIVLDGQSTITTASSAGALRRMRLPNRSRLLWIDAICINQQDIEERSQQVSIMSYVYSTAERALVWLGDSDIEPKRLADALDVVMADWDKANDAIIAMPPEHPPQQSSIMTILIDDVASYATGELLLDIAALAPLYSAAWFRRLWVVQEAGLAQSSTCFFGRCQHSLEEVLLIGAWLKWNFERIQAIQPSLEWHNFDYRNLFGAASTLYDLINHLDEGVSAFTLLHSSSFLQKSNPKDTIYGLLGLFGRWASDQYPPLPALPEPDYSKTLPEILTQSARHFICKWGCTDVLNGSFVLPFGHQEGSEYPSWVPLFHVPTNSQHATHVRSSFDASLRQYYDCLDIPGDVDQGVLKLQGFVYDIVVSVAEDAILDLAEFEQFQKLIQIAPGMLRDQNPGVAITECNYTVAQALLGSFLDRADDTGEFHGVHNVGGAEALAHLDAFETYLELHGKLPTPPNEPIQDRMEEGKPKLHWMAWWFYYSMCFACMGRRFFVTERGYPGLGPPTTRPGDIATVLYGFQHPMMLRPCEGSHTLLGPGYVHGIMDGEAMREHKAHALPDQVFRIR